MDARASGVPRHAGVDWSWERHAVCVIDDDGRVLDRFDVEHRAKALRQMCERLRRHDVDRVAIERPDSPVVRSLLEAGLEVVVVSPRQVRAFRTRHGTAGNKDDRFDAYVLAAPCAPMGTAWARSPLTETKRGRFERSCGPART